MMRQRDWQQRLNAYLIAAQARYAETGLDWGRFDCCTFACDWVVEATGVDPMADYRGRYASKDEALAMLRANEDGTLEAAYRRRFGDAVAPALLQRGDLAFRKAEKAAGIVITSGARQAAVFLGENGFATMRMRDVDFGFRVGR